MRWVGHCGPGRGGGVRPGRSGGETAAIQAGAGCLRGRAARAGPSRKRLAKEPSRRPDSQDPTPTPPTGDAQPALAAGSTVTAGQRYVPAGPAPDADHRTRSATTVTAVESLPARLAVGADVDGRAGFGGS